jgi:hypothetical protein
MIDIQLSANDIQKLTRILRILWILLLADNSVTKYFCKVKNRFLLIKCITMGALSFPTPFFIYFFITNVDPNDYTYSVRFLLVLILLLSGALIGVGSYYKDSAIAALKDWYPSEKP